MSTGSPPETDHAIQFTVNGKAVTLKDFRLETTLLDYLRSIGLTGAKEGCAEGECGACTVVTVRERAGRTTYQPINSCLVFLPMADGQEIYTVEGLCESGRLSEVQQKLGDAGGSQCGYCTPGFVMSLFSEFYRNSRTGPCDPKALAGNLCRCTGYRPIRDAALALGPAPHDGFSGRLQRAAPKLHSVDLPQFSRPESLDDCLELLAGDPSAVLVSGATDLAVESNLRHRRFAKLISTESVEELAMFREGQDVVEIGAGLTLSEIEAHWTAAPSQFREWLELFASPLIRNRATLAGNLATASPIGDAAPFLLALDAVVNLAHRDSRRSLPISSFFLAYRKTAMIPGEMITSVSIPKPLPHTLRFFKIAKRKCDDISTVAAAIAIDLDPGGKVDRARFAYGGVAPTPIRAYRTEESILGRPWDLETVSRAQRTLANELTPISDHRGSADYRIAVAQSVIEKFWWDQFEEPAA